MRDIISNITNSGTTNCRNGNAISSFSGRNIGGSIEGSRLLM